MHTPFALCYFANGIVSVFMLPTKIPQKAIDLINTTRSLTYIGPYL